MGMPRIEIDFEFDMAFCFGIRLAPNAVFMPPAASVHWGHGAFGLSVRAYVRPYVPVRP